jgi:hypothetical protein
MNHEIRRHFIALQFDSHDHHTRPGKQAIKDLERHRGLFVCFVRRVRRKKLFKTSAEQFVTKISDRRSEPCKSLVAQRATRRCPWAGNNKQATLGS